jgi:hypothetical protein
MKWFISSLFVALVLFTYVQMFQDYQQHPEDYSSTELYHVDSMDKEGYFHAQNGHGQIMFTINQIKGGMIHVGDTVQITLDLAGQHPIVERY